MTSWLKWRLIGVFSTATLLSSGYWLQAQSKYPPPAKTPEKAGEMFFSLLKAGTTDINRSYGDFNWNDAFPYKGAILSSQLKAIDNGTGPPKEELFSLLASQAKGPQFVGRVTEHQGNQHLVEVMPTSESKGREVVVVPEDGGYRVDVKATFARWNDLSGLPLDEEWFRYTGDASPVLRTTETFARSQCQSNLKQIMLGVKQYIQDYDEKFPTAPNWANKLDIYLKDRSLYTCPTVPQGKANGYAFNQYLSKVWEANIDSVAATVSFYETSNYSPSVFGRATGRAYRHENGSILAFADGHVKYIKRDKEPYLYMTFNPDDLPKSLPRNHN